MVMVVNELSIFQNINPEEINDILKSLGARRISFRKDHIIVSNLVEDDLIGVILNGKASIVNYDYAGNRDIIDNLEYDDIFGKPFSYINSDVSIIASSDCEVLFLDYHLLISNSSKYDIMSRTRNVNLCHKTRTLEWKYNTWGLGIYVRGCVG